MNNELEPFNMSHPGSSTNDKTDNVLITNDQMHQIGRAADISAQNYRFADYKLRRSIETLRRQKAGLSLFQEFLTEVDIVPAAPLFESPEGWQFITWGLVDGFVKWQLREGYAIHSINVRLSSVKTYAQLAMQSGTISTETYALIATVHGYTKNEGVRVDQKRDITRVGFKKEKNIPISFAQATELKQLFTESEQGRRDSLLMCILLDHGLRVGELIHLKVYSIDFEKQILQFYRPKVQKVQRHYLSHDTLQAYSLCRKHSDWDEDFDAPLFRRSKKNKNLTGEALSTRGITHRVNALGKMIGIAGLSAHDCRHYWATAAAQNGTDPFVLQEAGGWSSLAMPRRYIEENEIANEGIQLPGMEETKTESSETDIEQ